ncbi:MAG TPA: carbamate kinase [Candidatus Enterenecus stercoripullorum]|nr:carbamate kinase [Candidatus Enterenecus stercoripullorum]
MSGPVKVVVALGGNALEDKSLPPTAASQLQVAGRTAQQLAQLSCAGYELAIVHGNGPQVGRILLASETAAEVTPPMPFDVCGAMSQGYIGYHLQQSLTAALRRRGRKTPVVTIITQMVVDPADPAFQNPTKPIGPFYTREQAQALERDKGYAMREDSGRGWRRVVPSPKPRRIVEIGTIKTLWDTTVSIACGGGGVPVIEREDGSLEGVAAVIDKDLAACRLAQEMEADILMILTEVPAVAIRFGKPDQEDLGETTAAQLEEYAAQGQFGAGSMLPKVQAAVDFVRSAPGRQAIITSLDLGLEALAGRAGTRVTG